MSAKLVAPDSGCVGVDMPDGTRLDRTKGRYEVDNPIHERMMRNDGFFASATGFRNAPRSWWCPECAAEKLFKTCGQHAHLGELAPTRKDGPCPTPTP